MRYAVLLADPEDFRPVELARALAARRRVPAHDLIAAARRCWGLVALGLARAEALAEASALSAAGLAALALPESLIETPAEAEPVETLDLAALARRPPLWVAAAGVPETRVKLVKAGRREREGRRLQSSDFAFHADLVFAERRLRVAAASFDYSCLGPKKGYAASGNFRALLETLSALRPEPALNRGARQLLDGRPARDLGYESLADLDREERWLLTLRALRP